MKTRLISGILIPILAATLALGCKDISGKKPDEAAKKTTDTAKKENCMKVTDSADVAAHISHLLTVKGTVERPLALTLDSLKQMNVVSIDSYNVVCQTGTRMSENKACRGVLLRDILDKAGIHQTGHKDRGYYFVARATDNYKAIFSWGEIYNNANGNNTYVVFEENGSPIAQKGEFVLICTNDIKTGPRHVYWLSTIEVCHID